MQIDIRQFTGPLDLLDYLIQRSGAPLEDIPIVEITDQYLAILYGPDQAAIDMNLASEFLLMASTLLHIKSRLLLPRHEKEEAAKDLDPREDLVLALLAYRRCKQLAMELDKKVQAEAFCPLKQAERAEDLGIRIEPSSYQVQVSGLLQAAMNVEEHNRQRFNAQHRRLKQLLKREKFSIRDKIVLIWTMLSQKSRLLFSDLFQGRESSKAEKISSFLAVLELLRLNRCRVWQQGAFAPILIEAEKTASLKLNEVQVSDED